MSNIRITKVSNRNCTVVLLLHNGDKQSKNEMEKTALLIIKNKTHRYNKNIKIKIDFLIYLRETSHQLAHPPAEAGYRELSPSPP